MGFVNNDNNLIKNADGTIIMGIDQSFTHTGVTIVDNEKVIFSAGIATTTKDVLERRIERIISFIIGNITKYKVGHVRIEGLSYGSVSASKSQLGGLFYCILLMLRELNIKYEIVTPTELKKAVTGKGNAKKNMMLESLDDDIVNTLGQLSSVKIGSKKFEDIVDSYCLSVYKKLD